MKCLLIGYGEIGQAVYAVLKDKNIINIIDYTHGPAATEKKTYDAMLVAIPYTENFVSIIKKYQAIYNIRSTVIFSTVAIGTCRKLHAVHSPVEGKHPNLAESIRSTTRWVGGYDAVIASLFHGFNTVYVDRPEITEFLKLSSTTLYGINIEFARYRKQFCDIIGMDYNTVKKFDRDYNQLYKDLGMDQFQRYILDPPDGKIGGHCVLGNAKLLNKHIKNDMVDYLLQINGEE